MTGRSNRHNRPVAATVVAGIALMGLATVLDVAVGHLAPPVGTAVFVLGLLGFGIFLVSGLVYSGLFVKSFFA